MCAVQDSSGNFGEFWWTTDKFEHILQQHRRLRISVFVGRHVCSLVRSECHTTAHPCLHSAVSDTDVCCVVPVPLWSTGQSSWLLNGEVLCFL
jgi:hypothetical protein